MGVILKEALIFVAGAGAGFIIGKKFYQEKYRREADEDIASVKEMTTQRINDMKEAIMSTSTDDILEGETVIQTMEDTNDISEEELKTNERIIMQYNAVKVKEGKVERPERSRPKDTMIYIISEEEFMEEGEYDKVSLEYFEGDGILVDDRDIPVDDPDKILGDGTLNNFVTSEDNEMYIRNDSISVDYELTRSEGNYRDFAASPHIPEMEKE